MQLDTGHPGTGRSTANTILAGSTLSVGWTANLSDKWPGLESMTNRDGHLAEDGVLLTSEGTPVINPWPKGYWPVNWLGGTGRHLMNGDARLMSRLQGLRVEPLQSNPAPKGIGGNCRMVADLLGDFRDEIVCVEGNKVVVYTNVDPVGERQKTRVSSREYRLWIARNWGAGYPTYFEFEE